MSFYESVLIARQDISSEQVDELVETFSTAITEGGGSVAKKEYWGLRNLAYRIRKNRKGHYVLLNIDAPAPAVHEMERQMRLNEDVLRYLTIKMDELEEGPSQMMQKVSSYDDRPRRGGDSDRHDKPQITKSADPVESKSAADKPVESKPAADKAETEKEETPGDEA